MFTTRHSLAAEESYGVRFDGGLGWAKTTLEHFRLFQADPITPRLPQRQCPALALVRGLTQSSPSCVWKAYSESTGALPQRSWSGSSDTTAHGFPLTPPHHDSHDTWWPAPHPQNITTHSILYSFPAEASNDGTPQPDSPEPLAHGLPSASTTRPPTPSEEDVPSYYEERMDQDIQDQDVQDHVQNQIFIEFLRHRQREAEDLFKRTGDPSGLLAVSRAAITAGEGVWRPSGLSYF